MNSFIHALVPSFNKHCTQHSHGPGSVLGLGSNDERTSSLPSRSEVASGGGGQGQDRDSLAVEPTPGGWWTSQLARAEGTGRVTTGLCSGDTLSLFPS